jgi:hypothetical protein
MRDMLKKECPTCDGGCVCMMFPCEECGGTGQVPDMEQIWELTSRCDVNQFWSALIGTFRGELRAWFCELAGAQAMLHQWDTLYSPDCPADEPLTKYSYPDTGLDPTMGFEHFTAPGDRLEKTMGAWWQLPMSSFQEQVKQACPSCGIPLRGYGELACNPNGTEQVSQTHEGIYKPKDRNRRVELVVLRDQLKEGRLPKVTDYIQNSER